MTQRQRDRVPPPRRSALFIPGTNLRAIEKARTLPADGLLFDLEDSVAPERKADARSAVRDALETGGYGPRECVVRVNALVTTDCDLDLEAMAGAPLSAVLFPKVDHAEQVLDAAERLGRAGFDDGVALWVMAESPRSVLNIDSIARASERLECIVVGTSDLGKEMRVPPTPGRVGLLAALSMCVMAARASGLDILDGVHLDLTDARGLAVACEQGRTLGFDGKTLIHPGQIEVANRAFSPTPAEIQRATDILRAWEAAVEHGAGVAVVDGRLVENLHVEEASRLLAMHEAITARNTQ